MNTLLSAIFKFCTTKNLFVLENLLSKRRVDINYTFADLIAGFCEFRIHELTIGPYIVSTISLIKF